MKAILRAGAYGKVKILFPMISHVQQVRAANALLRQARHELLQKGIPFDPHISAGIMIEIPSAAITADLLAKEAGFTAMQGTRIASFGGLDRLPAGTRRWSRRPSRSMW